MMPDERPRLTCIRVEDRLGPPWGGDLMASCELCRAPVYVSPAGLDALEAEGGGGILICSVCAEAEWRAIAQAGGILGFAMDHPCLACGLERLREAGFRMFRTRHIEHTCRGA